MGKKTKRWTEEDDSSSGSDRSGSSTDGTSPEESRRRRRRSEARRRNAWKKEGKAINMLTELKELMCKQSDKLNGCSDDNHEMRKQLEMLIESQNVQIQKLEKLTESQNDQIRKLEKLTESQNDQIQKLEKLTESQNDQIQKLEKLTENQNDQLQKLEKLTGSQNDQLQNLEKFTESQSDLSKRFELHTNGTSVNDSASLSSQLNQVQSPRYKLKFTSEMSKNIGKGDTLEISVALVDVTNNDATVENGPLASATVELVVVNADFNEHNNIYNWSRDEFKSKIWQAQGNSANGDVDHPVKSIVANGQFNLVQGVQCHKGFTIFNNSSNKRVRLGVMVVSPTEERVLEGLSNPFFVRGHDRNRQCKVRDGSSNTQYVQRSCQEQNGPMPNMQSPTMSNSIQGLNIIGGQPHLQFGGGTTMLSTDQSTSFFQQEWAQTQQQYQVPVWSAQATNNQTGLLCELTAPVSYGLNSNFMGNDNDMVDAEVPHPLVD